VVFYTSDNGFQQGEHRLTGKGFPYEESMQVPLIVRAPGGIEGQHRSELVGNIDYAPTIVEMAQAVPLLAMDGQSLVPLLRGTPVHWRREFLIEDQHQVFTGVRTANFMYTQYDYNHDGVPEETELYVLAPESPNQPSDPNEMQNQQGNPIFISTEARLQDFIERFREVSKVH
jgi:arylsulfatase A-like enzyme